MDNILEKFVDEIIALAVVFGYMLVPVIGIQMPEEALMMILAFYFAKKIATMK